jgi:hypothetical protein
MRGKMLTKSETPGFTRTSTLPRLAENSKPEKPIPAACAFGEWNKRRFQVCTLHDAVRVCRVSDRNGEKHMTPKLAQRLRSASTVAQYEIAYGRAMAKQAAIDSARSTPQDKPYTYQPPKHRAPSRPTARMVEIFDHLRKNPNSTAAQISIALGISADTVRRTLAIYCNKNEVTRHPKKKAMPYRFEVAK